MQHTENQAVVQASINEGNLFDNMKHLFASSTSIIGELMQNARRAKASKVEFTLDIEAESLTVVDNGQGIDDFSKLVALCESGWDDDTKVQDNPFGMGVFSYFFAAQEVIFHSNGKMLAITHADIRNKKPLQVLPCDVVAGTKVVLSGLDKTLLEQNSSFYESSNGTSAEERTKVHSTLCKNALGFPIEVVFNGQDLPRGKALGQGLNFIETRVGWLSLQGLTNNIDGEIETSKPSMYLQGLPIGLAVYGGSHKNVLHLDSTKFIARMPDRSHLFNQDEQEVIIGDEIGRVVRAFLADRKAVLDPQEFVLKHWQNCKNWGCFELMNDIDFVPAHIAEELISIRVTEATRYRNTRNMSGVLSRQDFVDGKVKAWLDVPEVYGGGDDRAVIARWFMLESGIREVESVNLPINHWLLNILVRADNVSYTWAAEEEEKCEGLRFHGNEGSCVFRRAKSVDVTATWDHGGTKQSLAHRATTGWVMVPDNPEKGLADSELDDEQYELSLVCYKINGDSLDHTHPVDVFGDYEDESDSYREEWRDDALTEWNQVILQVFKKSLHLMVRDVLRNNLVSLTKDYDNKFCLVAKVPGNDGWRNSTALDLCDAEFWQSVQSMIDTGQAGNAKEAFEKAVQAALAKASEGNA